MATNSAFWEYSLGHLRHQTRHANITTAIVSLMAAHPTYIHGAEGRASEFFEELREFTDEPEQQGKSEVAVADEFVAAWNAAHP